MTKKILSLMSASFLVLIFMLTLASATLNFSNVPNELSQSGSPLSFSMTVGSNESEVVTLSVATLEEDGKQVTFTSQDVELNNNETSVTIFYNVGAGFEFEFGKTYTTILTADGTVSDDKTQVLTFEESDFCENCANEGDLDMDIEVNVKEGFGDDDDYWYPFDEIEVELDIENNGAWDVQDIEIEWELYTEDGTKIMDGDESDFDLDEGDDETITFTFVLDEDVDEFEGIDEVTLYVKARGEIDDSKSVYDGNDTCVSVSKTVEMVNDEFVLMTNLEVNGEDVDDFELSGALYCGASLDVSADLWNVGDDDQEDVELEIYSKELGIDETIKIGDVDAFESEEFSITLDLADDVEDGWYLIDFEVYDEDHDIYETDEEEDEAKFTLKVNVQGCSTSSTTSSGAKAVMAATLESGGVAGEELILSAAVTNTGSEAQTFTMSLNGYSEWSTLLEVTPSTLVLASGETKVVSIKLNVDKEASGDKTFSLDVLSNGVRVVSQPLAVSLQEAEKGFSLDMFGDNSFLWLVGALNVILIVMIIVVAIRIMRK